MAFGFLRFRFVLLDFILTTSPPGSASGSSCPVWNGLTDLMPGFAFPFFFFATDFTDFDRAPFLRSFFAFFGPASASFSCSCSSRICPISSASTSTCRSLLFFFFLNVFRFLCSFSGICGCGCGGASPFGLAGPESMPIDSRSIRTSSIADSSRVADSLRSTASWRMLFRLNSRLRREKSPSWSMLSIDCFARGSSGDSPERTFFSRYSTSPLPLSRSCFWSTSISFSGSGSTLSSFSFCRSISMGR